MRQQAVRVDPRLLSWDRDKRNEPYQSRSRLVRWLFWRRFDALLEAAQLRLGERVLDFGFGNGVFLPSLCRAAGRADGVDVDSNPDEVRRLLARFGAEADLRLLEGNRTPYPDASFDAIFAADVLEHIRDLDPAVAELKRILRPGGRLLISAPTENAFYKLCRNLSGLSEPEDHYRGAMEIFERLGARFAVTVTRRLPVRLAPQGLSLFWILKCLPRSSGSPRGR